MRWLLFRLLFHSGYKKLESGCPTWWGLTALDWHFESQCIPTPLSYHAHHLPKLWLKFGVAVTYITQLGVVLLNFSPNRRLRIFGAWCHILHQAGILVTGNYNFFNLLTILVCLASFDDEHINFLTGVKNTPKKSENSVISTIFTVAVEITQLAALTYLVLIAFDFDSTDIRVNETAEDQSTLKTYMAAVLKSSIVVVIYARLKYNF